jgi:hypothetical protein
LGWASRTIILDRLERLQSTNAPLDLFSPTVAWLAAARTSAMSLRLASAPDRIEAAARFRPRWTWGWSAAALQQQPTHGKALK